MDGSTRVVHGRGGGVLRRRAGRRAVRGHRRVEGAARPGAPADRTRARASFGLVQVAPPSSPRTRTIWSCDGVRAPAACEGRDELVGLLLGLLGGLRRAEGDEPDDHQDRRSPLRRRRRCIERWRRSEVSVAVLMTASPPRAPAASRTACAAGRTGKARAGRDPSAPPATISEVHPGVAGLELRRRDESDQQRGQRGREAHATHPDQHRARGSRAGARGACGAAGPRRRTSAGT